MTDGATDRVFTLRSGLQIAARHWAGGSCRVLALHGWLDNAGSFDTLAPLLPHCEVMAIDLPGHGQSQWKAPDAEYHYVDWITAVWDILDALQWDRACLLGHSMGAGISALFAGACPDRVERLVLLEGLGPYSTAASAMLENTRRALTARQLTLERVPRNMANVDAAIARKLAALPYLGETARNLVERGVRPTDEGGVSFSHDPRLTGRSLLRLTEEQVLVHLRAITAPTLIVRAREGLPYPTGAGDIDARLAAVDHAETIAVDGHHHVHLTHPQRVAPFVAGFLEF